MILTILICADTHPSTPRYIIHSQPRTLSQNCQNLFLVTFQTKKKLSNSCQTVLNFYGGTNNFQKVQGVFTPSLPQLSLKWKRSLKDWKREINAQMSCLYCAVHIQSLSSIRSSISYLSSLNLQPSRNWKICNMATRLTPLGVRNHLDNVHNFCRFSFVLSLLRLLSETS